jgi:hypothetical protein
MRMMTRGFWSWRSSCGVSVYAPDKVERSRQVAQCYVDGIEVLNRDLRDKYGLDLHSLNQRDARYGGSVASESAESIQRAAQIVAYSRQQRKIVSSLLSASPSSSSVRAHEQPSPAPDYSGTVSPKSWSRLEAEHRRQPSAAYSKYGSMGSEDSGRWEDYSIIGSFRSIDVSAESQPGGSVTARQAWQQR